MASSGTWMWVWFENFASCEGKGKGFSVITILNTEGCVELFLWVPTLLYYYISIIILYKIGIYYIELSAFVLC